MRAALLLVAALAIEMQVGVAQVGSDGAEERAKESPDGMGPGVGEAGQGEEQDCTTLVLGIASIAVAIIGVLVPLILHFWRSAATAGSRGAPNLVWSMYEDGQPYQLRRKDGKNIIMIKMVNAGQGEALHIRCSIKVASVDHDVEAPPVTDPIGSLVPGASTEIAVVVVNPLNPPDPSLKLEAHLSFKYYGADNEHFHYRLLLTYHERKVRITEPDHRVGG